MMDWTDRHCRVLHRLLSRRARLYTEMTTADAVIHGDRDRLLGFSGIEHPVVLQLGGSDPKKLASAARIGSERGYDEINLNAGCPSDRVQSGCFGAILMRTPELAGECVAAMRAAAPVPVTVKCRIGVDDQNPEEALPAFVDACMAAGADTFISSRAESLAVRTFAGGKPGHSAAGLSAGLPAEAGAARTTIIVNGGISSLDAAEAHLAAVDGVMLGRAAYQNPGILADVDRRFFGEAGTGLDEAIEAYTEYIAALLAEGVPLNAMTKHVLGLFQGRRGARMFRRHLGENATRKGAGLSVLRDALAFVEQPATAAA